MKYNSLTRRHFLQGLSGAVLALPSLSSLWSREAAAQSMQTSNVRFIALTGENSAYAHEEQWYPQGFPTQVIPGGHHNIRHQRLSTVARTSEGGLSEIIGPRFIPHLDKISYLRGLDLLPRFSHSRGATLGNFATQSSIPNASEIFTPTPTIDQVMAHSSRIYPSVPRLRSVAFSVAERESKVWGYQNPQDPASPLLMLPVQRNPRTIFSELFSGVSSSNQRVDPRISILDRVLVDYRSLVTHPRLSRADQLKLEAHAEMIHELEQRLSVTYGVCTVPTEPPEHRGYSNSRYPSNLSLHQYWQDHIDVVTSAMKCGLTRVATSHVTKVLREFSINSGDVSNGWHAASHAQENAVANQTLATINRAYAENIFLKFIEALDEPEDENSTYLDNSIVLWCNENSTNHATSSMPVLIAGGGGGHLRQGEYIDFSNRDANFTEAQLRDWRMTSQESVTEHKRPGLFFTRLYVSIFQAMGMTPPDYERPGEPGYGRPEDGQRRGQIDNYDLAQRGNPLPYYFIP